MRECRYSSIASVTLNLGKTWRYVVKFTRPAALTSARDIPLSNKQDTVWAPTLVWTNWRRENVLLSPAIEPQFLSSAARSLVTTSTLVIRYTQSTNRQDFVFLSYFNEERNELFKLNQYFSRYGEISGNITSVNSKSNQTPLEMDRQIPASRLHSGKDLFCEVTCSNSGRYNSCSMGFRGIPPPFQANTKTKSILIRPRRFSSKPTGVKQSQFNEMSSGYNSQLYSVDELSLWQTRNNEQCLCYGDGRSGI